MITYKKLASKCHWEDTLANSLSNYIWVNSEKWEFIPPQAKVTSDKSLANYIETTTGCAMSLQVSPGSCTGHWQSQHCCSGESRPHQWWPLNQTPVLTFFWFSYYLGLIMLLVLMELDHTHQHLGVGLVVHLICLPNLPGRVGPTWPAYLAP